MHFFLFCPSYAAQRNTLFAKILELTENTYNLTNLETLTRIERFKVVHFLLHGDETLSYDQNISIFIAIHDFIKSTKRFEC